MRIIPLTRGMVTRVDDNLYDSLSVFNWHAMWGKGCWYAARTVRVNGKDTKVLMHHVVWGQKIPLDHFDRDSLNNQRNNLRPADQSHNQMNKMMKTGKFKGVTWDKNKWIAQLTYKGANYRLGRFVNAEEAARAYDDKARELFGEFACTNFPGVE